MKKENYVGSKFSFGRPEVWIPTSEEDAQKEIPFLIKLFKKYGEIKTILDVGCGMGRHLALLSKKGYKCEGVEPHPKMI
ncbi:MAG: class I SAM-dependent methyltransferase, partial [Nanoarchaeota archaeon]|nr:class I SAM-dependent methyltransferase [Nanoarchaeota archaeon]